MIVSSLWSVALLDWHICISFVVSGILTNLTLLLPSFLIFDFLNAVFVYNSHQAWQIG